MGFCPDILSSSFKVFYPTGGVRVGVGVWGGGGGNDEEERMYNRTRRRRFVIRNYWNQHNAMEY